MWLEFFQVTRVGTTPTYSNNYQSKTPLLFSLLLLILLIITTWQAWRKWWLSGNITRYTCEGYYGKKMFPLIISYHAKITTLLTMEQAADKLWYCTLDKANNKATCLYCLLFLLVIIITNLFLFHPQRVIFLVQCTWLLNKLFSQSR
jgi:hypothetical protein